MSNNTEPLTHAKIEHAIRVALARQEDLLTRLAEAGDERAESDVEYKRAAAEARLRARHQVRDKKATEGELTDEATLATIDQYRRFAFAEINYKNIQEAKRTVTTRLDSLRTLAASHREVTG